MSESNKQNILGRSIRFDDGRIVFIGEDHDDNQRQWKFIGFKSKTGDDTKLVLSPEACEALKELLTDPMAGMPLKEFPHKMVWRQVKYDERPSPPKGEE